MQKFKDLYEAMKAIKKGYSQNSEEEYVLNYFGVRKGTFLDLGSNDGQSLSNTRALAELGWKGYCIEPAFEPFQRLHALYPVMGDVLILKCAVGTETGTLDFLESGEIKGEPGTGLVSSLDKSQKDKWGKHVSFSETKVQCYTWKDLQPLLRYKKFEMVSIDCENLDYDILIQMDLAEMGVEFLIVESNSIENQKYIDYCAKFGLNLIHSNMENLLFAK